LDKIDDGEDIYETEDLNDHDYDIVKCNDYEDWALIHNMNEYKDENVFYLGVNGTVKNIKDGVKTDVKNGDLVFKYGISCDEFRRTKEHSDLMDDYTCFYVVKHDKYNFLEKDFEKELERKKLRRHMKVGKKMYMECFIVNDKFDINGVYEWIENWVKKNYDYSLKSNDLLLSEEETKRSIE
jgi:hypothetical protein